MVVRNAILSIYWLSMLLIWAVASSSGTPAMRHVDACGRNAVYLSKYQHGSLKSRLTITVSKSDNPTGTTFVHAYHQ